MTAPNGGWDPPPGPYRDDAVGRRPRNATAAIGAIVTATVIILAALTVYAFSGHRPHSTVAGPPATTTASTPATAAATTAATAAKTTAANTTAANTTAASSTGSPNTFSTCTNATANLDLINLTVALAYSTSYAGADPYNRTLIDSCTTAGVRVKLKPYYGKVFGTSFTDLTGNNDLGPTDRYHVPLVNTSEHVTFILKRKSIGPGFRVVGVMA